MIAFILYIIIAFAFTAFFQVLEKHHPKVWAGGLGACTHYSMFVRISCEVPAFFT